MAWIDDIDAAVEAGEMEELEALETLEAAYERDPSALAGYPDWLQLVEAFRHPPLV